MGRGSAEGALVRRGLQHSKSSEVYSAQRCDFKRMVSMHRLLYVARFLKLASDCLFYFLQRFAGTADSWTGMLVDDFKWMAQYAEGLDGVVISDETVAKVGWHGSQCLPQVQASLCVTAGCATADRGHAACPGAYRRGTAAARRCAVPLLHLQRASANWARNDDSQ